MAATAVPLMASAFMGAVGNKKNKPASQQYSIPPDLLGTREGLANLFSYLFGFPSTASSTPQTGGYPGLNRLQQPKPSAGSQTQSPGSPLGTAPGGSPIFGSPYAPSTSNTSSGLPLAPETAPQGAGTNVLGGALSPFLESVLSRYRELLSPDFFNVATLGGSPEAAMARIAEAERPIFEQDLGKSLDLGQARLGGQYGVRFGSDVARSFEDITTRALGERSARLEGLMPELQRNFLTGLSLYGDTLRGGAEQTFYEPLRLALQYASSYPGSVMMPSQPSTATMLSQYPMYYSLLNQNSGGGTTASSGTPSSSRAK